MKTMFHKGRKLINAQIERDIEDEFVLYAAECGVAAKKFKDESSIGAPDRICFCPKSHTFFIEFKKPGEELAPLQEDYRRFLKSLDYHVYTCDNLDDAKTILRHELKESKNAN